MKKVTLTFDNGPDRSVTPLVLEELEKLNTWGDFWYRPYGQEGKLGSHIFSENALSVFSRLGYSTLLWNSVPGDWRNPHGWLEDALQDVAANDHTVVVLHDIPGAVKTLLPIYLDELSTAGVHFTLELPESVVPVYNGLPTAQLAGMVAGRSNLQKG